MASDSLIRKVKDNIDSFQDFPKEGILYRDISPILQNPELYKEIIKDFANFSRGKVDVICGIESRGYFFGIGLAAELDVPFVTVRKKGKLPPPVISEKYDLEYGSSEIEVRTGVIKEGQRVLVHDDLLATGGTTSATANLVEKQGAKVVQFSFLVGLDFLHGEEKLKNFNADIYKIVTY